MQETDAVFEDGSIYQADMEGAFITVQEAVKRADRADGGAARVKPQSDEDEAVQDEMYAREAGYLIGVQVGLRLRR